MVLHHKLFPVTFGKTIDRHHLCIGRKTLEALVELALVVMPWGGSVRASTFVAVTSITPTRCQTWRTPLLGSNSLPDDPGGKILFFTRTFSSLFLMLLLTDLLLSFSVLLILTP